MFKSVAGFIAASALTASAAMAAPEDITFPKDYEVNFTNYLSLDRGNGKQVGRIFANDIAVSGVRKDGKFPDGSVLVMEVSKVKKGPDGKPLKSNLDRLIRDGKAAVVVMQKIKGSGKGLPEELQNDDWEFAAFSPSGKFLKKDFNKCRACHAPLEENRHVFSYEHLQKAELKDYMVKASFDGGSKTASQRSSDNSAAQKLLDSISLPNAKKTEGRTFKSAKALLDAISLPSTAKKKVNKKQVADLLASISTPSKAARKADNRNAQKLLDSISAPTPKKAGAKDKVRFSQNLAIKRVISSQIRAFRGNNSGRAFAFAAPSIRKTFGNSGSFMKMVRTSYPSIYYSKRTIFPKMQKVKGSTFNQRVILEDRSGNLVTANYRMVKIGGHWRVAGCEITKKRYH